MSWFRVASVIIFCICSASNISSENNDAPAVRLNSGLVKGSVEWFDGIEVRQYLGIPYAEPPIGDLRFRKPRPITHHYEISGRVWPPKCLQHPCHIPVQYSTEIESEECLFLNVVTPKSNGDDLKPVMFFIHGGGYEFGSASSPIAHGVSLAALGGVVFVTVNYRVSVFGFLYGESDDAPGNLGLWDQTLALEWVQDNIAYFGGDPQRVTIFGESAGGMAVASHLLSSQSRHLYHSAIVMSGSTLSPVFHYDKSVILYRSRFLVKRLGCGEGDVENGPLSKEELDCLRKIDGHTLLNATKGLVEGELFQFVSIHGDEFLPSSPKIALRADDFIKNISVTMGVMEHEGAMWEILIRTSPAFSQIAHLVEDGSKSDWNHILRSFLTQLTVPNELQQSVGEFYFEPAQNSTSSAVRAFTDAIGDLVIACPTILFAQQISKSNNVYGYHVTYKTNSTNPAVNDWCMTHHGACHVLDLIYLMGLPFTKVDEFSDEDRLETRHIVKIFTDFASNGKGNWLEHQVTQSGLVLPFNYEINHQVTDHLKTDFKYFACKLWQSFLL